jgi:hypothetical protein
MRWKIDAIYQEARNPTRCMQTVMFSSSVRNAYEFSAKSVIDLHEPINISITFFH